MTILLSNDEIASLLDINDVLEALEEAYREAAKNRAILGARRARRGPGLLLAGGARHFLQPARV